MLRRIYERVLALAGSPRAPLWLALVSFAESSFFPVPPDALLLPMVLARPGSAFRFATICTVASVAGGALGYWIGATLYDQVAAPLVRFYHYEAGMRSFQDGFAANGAWIILLKGLTPIPYKIVTITAGLAHFDFATFMTASVITRGGRFFLVAWLARQFGAPVQAFIEKRLMLVTTLIALAVVLGIVLVKLL